MDRRAVRVFYYLRMGQPNTDDQAGRPYPMHCRTAHLIRW
jgi:hypothetical protein